MFNFKLFDCSTHRNHREAVKNIPQEIKIKYPGIPWKEIVGMRDILIHEYFWIDLELTWETIKEDIPRLKKEILKIKKGNKF